jgi:hypothetical protein
MNKKLLIGLFGILLVALMLAIPVMAKTNTLLQHVEVEDIATGWGLKISQHATDSTQYGNYYTSCSGHDGRLVTDTTHDAPVEFTFVYDGSARKLVIRHLDGFANDGFSVDVQGEQEQWIPLGVYVDTHNTETWVTSEFLVDPATPHLGLGHSLTIRISLTDARHSTWSSWGIWGQLAIDWMELYGNGAP